MADKKCIYVVDDEQVIARTICLILQHSGYDTTMFLNAESALQRIEETQPDLILSDVVLGGELTGIDLAVIVAERYPQVRIMLISGQAHTSELLDRAHGRGFDVKVHAKPIAPRAMLQQIALLLSTV